MYLTPLFPSTFVSLRMAGDLDYASLLQQIKRHGHEPHLVLEQSVEAGSPETMTCAAAHQVGVQNLRAGLPSA